MDAPTIANLREELEATRRELDKAREEAREARLSQRIVENTTDGVAEELRQAQARYGLVMQASKEAIWERDLLSGAVDMTPAVAEQLGYMPNELPRHIDALRDNLHPDDLARTSEVGERQIAEGKAYDLEVRVRRKSGEYRWYRLVGQPVRDESGRAVKLVGSMSDVHERKLAETALRDSERMFRALFEGTSMPVTLRSLDSQGLIDCNEAAVRLFGFDSRADLYGSTPADLSPPLQADGRPTSEVARETIAHALRDGFFKGEWLSRRKNGETFPVDLRITVIQLEDGRHVFQTAIEETTQRKRLEAAVQKRTEREALVSAVAREFVRTGTTDAFSFAARSLGEALGVHRIRLRRHVGAGLEGGATSLAEWQADGIPPFPTTSDENLARVQRWLVQRLSAGGDPVIIDDGDTLPPATTVRLTGMARTRALAVVPLSNAGTLLGWITLEQIEEPRAWSEEDLNLARVIAEIVSVGLARADAEERTRASEQRYRALVDRSKDMIVTIDFDGRPLFASPAVFDLTGYTAEEVLATPGLLVSLLTPDSRKWVEELFARARATGELPSESFVLSRYHRDGRLRYVEYVVAPISDAAGRVVAAQYIARDITERKNAEEAGRVRAEREALLSEVSRRFLNDPPEAAIGATLEGIAAALAVEHVALSAPDGKDRLWSTHQHDVPGAPAWAPFEGEPVQPGTFAHVEMGAAPAGQDAAPTDLVREAWLASLQRSSDGTVLHAPVGYGGRLLGILSVGSRAERQWTDDDRATLRAVGELVAIGRVRQAADVALAKAKEDAIAASVAKSAFLANMSHELRTPLNGVIGMVDLLAATTLDERQRRYAEVARASANLLLSVINDVLDVSKIEAGKLELDSLEFAVDELAMEVASILALTAEEKGLELHCDVDARLAMPLVGDPARLRQVLVNLVNNAIKFTRLGEVTLRATLASESESAARVRVEVRDTGVGIAPEAQARLFRPFTQLDATATREHGGTGLGLAICRELVTRMGGSIGVESLPGSGSTFWFEVELAKGSLRSAPEYSLALRGKRVLVVDDNATNRELVRMLLAQAGMACETAHDGFLALRMLENAHASGPYALILVDHRMPGMDGRELVRRIRSDARFDDARIVIIGSVARSLDPEEQRALGIAGYATKPIWRRQLLRVVRAALNGVHGEKSPDPAASPAAASPIGRALLVEDSPVSAEVAAEILSTGGYAFDLVGDGAAAVEAIRSRPYDFVLMDCQLPVMDGFEATRRIRALEREGAAGRASPIPIIALTASATTGDLALCREAGMDDYVAKPVDARRLLATIANYVGRHRDEPATPRPSSAVERVADLPRALERLGGNGELLERIAARFVDAVPLARNELREAAEKRDAGGLAFAAHRLRGQASSFDASPLVAASMSLEDAAKRESWRAADAALVGVERELERLVAFLRRSKHSP